MILENLSQIESILDKKIGKVSNIVPIYKGRNSNIILLEFENRDKFILKKYKHDPYNKRNRLKSEFFAIHYMMRIGIQNIPKLIYVNRKYNFIILEFINGKKIKDITFYHIERCIFFLDYINKYRYTSAAKFLINAAEACFYIDDLIKVIEQRFFWLKKHGIDKGKIGFYDFLKEVYLYYTKLKSNVLGSIENYKTRLEISEKILSPSDFGFHNALETKEDVFFLDFEYFGWDDASKLICDFLFHPAMNISFDVKKYFVTQATEIFSFLPNIKEKITIYYPFIGINWILRLLNEFLPEKLNKLKQKDDISTILNIQKKQLKKAKLLLYEIKKNKEFPY